MSEPLETGTNDLGFTTVRLHYSSDPAKSPASEEGKKWLAQMRQLWPDPNLWDIEYEISWWIAQGARVFPSFHEATHCRALQPRSRAVVYRAWDFGWRSPACLIAQFDPQDRLVILHEMVGREQTTREFARDVIAQCSKWFPFHAPGYRDYCDPAGQQASSTAAERTEVRDIEILNVLGISPTWDYGWSRKDGRALISQLLAPRTDTTPGIYVDRAACPILVQAFLGKYVYPETKSGKIQDEPDENNHPWADVMACLRYLATGLYSALGLRRVSKTPTPELAVTWHGYGSPLRDRQTVKVR